MNPYASNNMNNSSNNDIAEIKRMLMELNKDMADVKQAILATTNKLATMEVSLASSAKSSSSSTGGASRGMPPKTFAKEYIFATLSEEGQKKTNENPQLKSLCERILAEFESYVTNLPDGSNILATIKQLKQGNMSLKAEPAFTTISCSGTAGKFPNLLKDFVAHFNNQPLHSELEQYLESIKKGTGKGKATTLPENVGGVTNGLANANLNQNTGYESSSGMQTQGFNFGGPGMNN